MSSVTAPLGFFDPLGLTPENREEVVLWREAELNHGRVVMMAALGFFVQENGFHPIFPDVGGPAAFQLDQIHATGKGAAEVVGILLFPIMINRATKGWVEPNVSSDASTVATVRTLKSGYEPDDLGFDPGSP